MFWENYLTVMRNVFRVDVSLPSLKITVLLHEDPLWLKLIDSVSLFLVPYSVEYLTNGCKEFLHNMTD